MMKRLLDILGAVVGLIICGIVSILLVPIIRRDGGPAIFAQKRVGQNGRIFTFYKFRSMYVDAEERKKTCSAKTRCKVVCLKWKTILELLQLDISYEKQV